jgi:hypothetical protein
MSHTVKQPLIGRLGILKEYPDGYVLPEKRYNQIKPKTVQPYQLLSRDLIGYVWNNGCWIIYREEDQYYKSFFAKNMLWFNAMTTGSQFALIGKLPQIYVI